LPGQPAKSYDTTSTKTRIETPVGNSKKYRPQGYDTTSTKTRIETNIPYSDCSRDTQVMTPLPPKQGLKRGCCQGWLDSSAGYDTTSTKTRIETEVSRHISGLAGLL